MGVTICVDGRAFDVIHDQERHPIFGGASVEQLYDIGMVERGESLTLVPKTPEQIGVAQTGRNDFNRNLFSVLIVGTSGQIDSSHATLPDTAKNLVGTDTLIYRRGFADGRLNCGRNRHRPLVRGASFLIRGQESLDFVLQLFVARASLIEEGAPGAWLFLKSHVEQILKALPSARVHYAPTGAQAKSSALIVPLVGSFDTDDFFMKMVQTETKPEQLTLPRLATIWLNLLAASPPCRPIHAAAAIHLVGCTARLSVVRLRRIRLHTIELSPIRLRAILRLI
jgi:hypothetical protein